MSRRPIPTMPVAVPYYFRLSGPRVTMQEIGWKLIELKVQQLGYNYHANADRMLLFARMDIRDVPRIRSLAVSAHVGTKTIGPYTFGPPGATGPQHIQPFTLRTITVAQHPIAPKYAPQQRVASGYWATHTGWYMAIDSSNMMIAQHLASYGRPVVCFRLANAVATYWLGNRNQGQVIRRRFHTYVRDASDIPNEESIFQANYGNETSSKTSKTSSETGDESDDLQVVL